jgi:hypothetical protein
MKLYFTRVGANFDLTQVICESLSEAEMFKAWMQDTGQTQQSNLPIDGEDE